MIYFSFSSKLRIYFSLYQHKFVKQVKSISNKMHILSHQDLEPKQIIYITENLCDKINDLNNNKWQ